MDLIRRTLITPKAIREMIDIVNEHVRLQSENQAPELERARRQIASLEKQDANLRRALRTARPNAAERIALEIDQVATEIRQAVAKRDELEQVRTPMSTSKRFIQQTIDEMTGLIENAALDTRVAWVRDLLDRVTVDGREEHAVAIWRTATDDGVNRSDSVSSWLRRAGAGRVLNSRGEAAAEIPLPHPTRSREWLTVALLECARCHQVVERRSPVQHHCPDCTGALRRLRSRQAMARRRQHGP